MNKKKMLGLLLLLPTVLFAQQVEIPNGWSDSFAYVNGARIHYYHATPQPEKPVIVMIHGVTDNGLCWATLTAKLQNNYNIYMLDARGHGLSDPFTANDDSQTLVKDVVDFVKVMNFKNPILLGHSMGAATVMRVGAEYPDVARAIIMLDPGVGAPRGASTAARTPQNTPAPRPAPVKSADADPNKISFNMFGAPETLVAQNNYSLEKLIELGRRQNPLWDKVDIEYWAVSKKQYHGPYSTVASQAMTGTMNTRDALAKIAVPTIILKADASPEVRKANEQAATVMQKGKLVHIDGAAHNLHHDKLERTTQVIKEFLSTL